MTEEETKEIFKSFLIEFGEKIPNAKVLMQSWHSVNDNIGGLEVTFKSSQNAFEGTAFHSKIHNQYIHYTSKKSLLNILNEGAVRCYSANRMNDPNEIYGFITQLGLNINQEFVEKIRRSLFIFSMCRYDEDFPDDKYMWSKYGEDGEGVGIVFEIENESGDWLSTYIGDVNYSSDVEKEELLTKTIEICDKYSKLGLNSNEYPTLLYLLFAMNKGSLWSNERETRAVTHINYEPMFYGTSSIHDFNIDKHNIGHYVDDSDWLSAYYKLDLANKFNNQIKELSDEDAESLKKIRLRLRIKQIICGYKLSSTFRVSLERLLIKYLQERKIDEMIPVLPSRYWEPLK
jgi:hypothetical protein